MRRNLGMLGSVAVIAVIVFGIIRFTATDDTTDRTSAGGETGSSETTATTGTTTGGSIVVEDPDETTSTTLAARDATQDTDLAALLVTPDVYGPGFTALGPEPEEAQTRCGTAGLDDPRNSQGRAMVGVENQTGTLSVIQAIRSYPDAQPAADAYRASVAALNCPTIELAEGQHPLATGSEVGGLGADQSYALDYYPDATASPAPIGGGFVARVGNRVLTLRYFLDPNDPAAAQYDLAAIVRAAIAKLT